ncbi:hypothetical protein [Paraclostridium dentum]|uniref:hypothetical protein n=1 Tax=Paraclostridium dentum TaxID=2662455 RepID=UPI003F3172DF
MRFTTKISDNVNRMDYKHYGKKNIWKQSSDPHKRHDEGVDNYYPVHLDWTTSHFKGIAKSSRSTDTYMDCSPIDST